MITGTQAQNPLVAYTSPFKFCDQFPSGNFCDPSFPRSYVDCPNGLTRFCPARTVCEAGVSVGTVQCAPNLCDPIVKLCRGKPEGSSYCYQNTTVECSSAQQFLCPPDFLCDRRGRRAYCVEPQYVGNIPSSGFCNGLSSDAHICHPTNLKKIVTCPSESISFCPIGQMCDVSVDATKASCIPYQDDPARFCYNKALYASYCLPYTNGEMIVCGQSPNIVKCLTGRCFQNHSIVAQCI